MGTPIARVTDRVAHPLPGVLQPGPGSNNVIVGFLPAWRGVPALAAAALSAAKAVSDATVNAAKAASTAAMGTPAAPAAKAAEEAVKAAALAAMTAMMNSAKAASTSMSGGSPDIHICGTFPPTPAHGPGMVLDGNPTVLINGLPACQVGDKVTEALGPPDPIIMGKANVIIGENGGGGGGGGGLAGMLAAAAAAAAALIKNILSKIAEAVKAIAAAVIEAAKSLAAYVVNAVKSGANAIYNYFASHTLFEADGDVQPGILFGGNWSDGLFGRMWGEFGVGAYKDEGAGYFFESFPFIGGSYKVNVLTVEGKGSAGAGYGAGASGNVKGVAAGGELSIFIGPDMNNPWFEFGIAPTAGQAEATATSLVGYDGRRVGIAAEGKAAADGLAFDIKSEINIPIPGTGTTYSARSKLGVTGYSAGGGAEGHAFYDTETDRIHGGGEGEIAVGAGIGVAVDWSVGKPHQSRDRQTSY